MENIKCEGNCTETHGDHKGKVKAVIVSSISFAPMKFNYCENAIEEDERRGFFIENDDETIH